MSTIAGYMKLADGVAAEIGAGRLKAGDRLPPQRAFAYERGIAVSTASRVYSELLRRGLVGEVGRGTFISGQSLRGAAAAKKPGNARVDLEFNYPTLATPTRAHREEPHSAGKAGVFAVCAETGDQRRHA